MDTLSVKARENGRRGSAVKTLIVEADPNPQFPLLPLAFGRTFPVRKVNKDGRSLRTCQEARTREKTCCPAESRANLLLDRARTSRRFCPRGLLRPGRGNAHPGTL